MTDATKSWIAVCRQTRCCRNVPVSSRGLWQRKSTYCPASYVVDVSSRQEATCQGLQHCSGVTQSSSPLPVREEQLEIQMGMSAQLKKTVSNLSDICTKKRTKRLSCMVSNAEARLNNSACSWQFRSAGRVTKQDTEVLWH